MANGFVMVGRAGSVGWAVRYKHVDPRQRRNPGGLEMPLEGGEEGRIGMQDAHRHPPRAIAAASNTTPMATIASPTRQG